MKKMILVLALLLTSHSLLAVAWRGLTDDNHYSGPKLTEADLRGKVVLVEMWGVYCPPCRASLPQIEQIWRSFKSKPFMLIGSHRQGHRPDEVKQLVEEHKLTYPIYGVAGLAENEPRTRAIPFLYVVNHRGKVVYSGHGIPEAIEAVVNALGVLNAGYSLTGEVIPRKYKGIEKVLVFGKPIKSVVRKLESDMKKAQRKSATADQRARAQEALEIMNAIETAKGEVKADIEMLKADDPVAAAKLMKQFMTTFPEDGAVYKDELKELIAKVKEQRAAAKKEQEAAKKNKKAK